MFSRKKLPAPVVLAAAPASAPSLKRAARSSVPSLISAELVVNGPLVSAGDIIVDGRIEGDVRSAGLVIGEHGLIHGEVMANDVTIRGGVQGNVRARKVLLSASCRIDGNIIYGAIAVEPGANVRGNFRCVEDPLSNGGGPKRK